MSKQKTEKIFNASAAGVNQPLFYTNENYDLISFQINTSEVCLCASTVSACCVCSCSDTFTSASHGFATGLKGQFTTTCADLPNGLCTCTDYFIIKTDDCTYQVASSRANAIIGTEIDLGDSGTGCHTFTPTATACDCGNGTITFHVSNETGDDATFACADYNCSVLNLNPCMSASTTYTFADFGHNSIQVDIDVTEGQWSVEVIGVAKRR